MRELYETIVRPVVTEKSSDALGTRQEYTFEVHPQATKPQIRAAIEHLFDVDVVKVRTLVQRSKRRTMGRSEGRRPAWKKAIVRLKDGDTIEIFGA